MLNVDRRLITHFEWPLLILVVLIMTCGLLTILSATYVTGRTFSPYVIRQAIWFGIGLVLMLAALAVDYRQLDRYGDLAYVAALALLLLVPVIGTTGGGARRWIGFGPIALQPSEFMKIALVIALARRLHRRASDSHLLLRHMVGPVVLMGIPSYLVLAQPDLGTAIVLGLGGLTVLLLAGMRVRLVLIGVAIIAAAVPFAWEHLKPYQRQRITSYLNPQADPLGAGYHANQSQIAIGSGMVGGKGYLHGTQNQLNFLPEQHTDFIFSVYAEEWGFIGTAMLLLLYAALITRGALIAIRARDNLGALIAAGLTGIVFWQIAVNIGMTSGVLPIVGITLPFLSYGGSSVLALMISIGLIMNVGMRRYTF